MPDENKARELRDAAEAVKGLVQAVPVYQDVVQPAARELGIGIQQAVRIALAPLRVLVWGYDTIGDYLDEALTTRLRGVPPDLIVSPSPVVAGPAVEALRFAGSDPELRELYANLLARAMDARTAREAHPAFVEILRQLTPDEARILRLLAEKDAYPVITVVSIHLADQSFDWVLRHFTMLGEQAGCAFAALTPLYLDNLSRLGLVEVHEDKRDAEPGAYEPLLAHPKVNEAVTQGRLREGDRAEIREEVLIVTSLGRQFCDAVVRAKPG